MTGDKFVLSGNSFSLLAILRREWHPAVAIHRGGQAALQGDERVSALHFHQPHRQFSAFVETVVFQALAEITQRNPV